MSSSAEIPSVRSETASSASSGTRKSDASALSGKRLWSLLRQEKHWVLLAVVYFFAWYIPPIPPIPQLLPGASSPVNWAGYEWLTTTHLQMFQPFVLPLAILLIWGRREQIHEVWQRVQARPPKNMLLRGNESILLIGCLTVLFSHFVKIKGVGVFGLLLIAVGVVYRLYGWHVLRAMWVPVLFLLLAIPPPDSIIERLNGAFLSGSMVIASAIFTRIGMPTGRMGNYLQFAMQGYGVEYHPKISSAVILIPTLVLLLWYGLYRLRRPGQILSLLILGTVFGMAVNLLRMVIIGKIFVSQQNAANFLMHMNAWPLIGVAFALTLGAERLFSRSHALNVPTQQTGRALNKFGQFVNLLLSPFVAVLSALGNIGRLWKASERGLERLLSKMGGKRSKRRNPW
jgi:hypothetical protein